MTQKFSHDPEVPAEQDVAKRVFDIANGHIRSAHTLISTPHPPSPLNPLHPPLPPPRFLRLANMDVLGAEQCSPARVCVCVCVCTSCVSHLTCIMVTSCN